jgi:hypothetical protein
MISFNGSQMISLKENYTLQDFTYKLAVQELEELEITDIADQKEHLRRRLLHDISQGRYDTYSLGYLSLHDNGDAIASAITDVCSSLSTALPHCAKTHNFELFGLTPENDNPKYFRGDTMYDIAVRQIQPFGSMDFEDFNLTREGDELTASVTPVITAEFNAFVNISEKLESQKEEQENGMIDMTSDTYREILNLIKPMFEASFIYANRVQVVR